MTLLAELYQQIRASPADDTIRLVLADYHEDQGQTELAAFIRLQVKRGQLPDWHADCVRIELQERALLAAHGETWRADLPTIEGVAWGSFRRGVTTWVAFDDFAGFQEHGARCLAEVPATGLMLRWPRLGDRAQIEEPIEGLRALTVVGTLMNQDDMVWLANNPLLSTIEALNLVGTEMDAQALGVLLNSPHLSQLKALRLPYHDFGHTGVALLTQKSLPNLIDLDLSVPTEDELGSGGRTEETMGAPAMALLSGWSGLQQLQRLNLAGNQLGTEGAQTLLATNMPALKELGLRGISDFGEDGRDRWHLAFQDAHPALQLETLDISESEIGKAGAKALVDSPALTQLKVLKMDYTQELNGVLKADWLDQVAILSLTDCGETTAQAVLKRAPQQVHSMNLSSFYGWSAAENIGRVLKKAPVQPSQLHLDISGAVMGDQQLKAISKVTSLPSLLSLVSDDPYWEDAEYSEAAKAAFLDSPLGQQLLSVFVKGAVSRLPPEATPKLGHPGYRGDLTNL